MISFKAMKTGFFQKIIFLNNEINGVYISNTYSKQIKIL